MHVGQYKKAAKREKFDPFLLVCRSQIKIISLAASLCEGAVSTRSSLPLSALKTSCGKKNVLWYLPYIVL